MISDAFSRRDREKIILTFAEQDANRMRISYIVTSQPLADAFDELKQVDHQTSPLTALSAPLSESQFTNLLKLFCLCNIIQMIVNLKMFVASERQNESHACKVKEQEAMSILETNSVTAADGVKNAILSFAKSSKIYMAYKRAPDQLFDWYIHG